MENLSKRSVQNPFILFHESINLQRLHFMLSFSQKNLIKFFSSFKNFFPNQFLLLKNYSRVAKGCVENVKSTRLA